MTINNRLTSSDKNLLASLKTGRSQEQIFNSIATSIYDSHEGKITEQESRQSARNFIGFCQKIIDIQVRLDKEQEKKDNYDIDINKSWAKITNRMA